MRRAVQLAFLVAALAVGLGASADREQYLGKPVQEIRFAADGEIVEADLRMRTGIGIGTPLTVDDVARSIRSLHSTGLFRNIRVDASLTPDDRVELTYVLNLHFRIERVDFDGIPDGESAVRNVVPIRVGDVASLDAIDRGAVEMRDQLVRRGYMEAIVDPAVNFERQTHTAVVTFFVQSGSRANVASIRFEGPREPSATPVSPRCSVGGSAGSSRWLRRGDGQRS